MTTSSTPIRQDFRFFHTLRVRWAEVDMQKIVFNGHYLMYFDTAIADYWRAMALSYEEIPKRFEGDMFVKKATVEYHASAKYDERLQVGVKCARIGTSSLTFTMAIFHEHRLLISGELLYVFADPIAHKSKPVPDALRDMFMAFERGEAMVTVRTGSWAELQAHAAPIRHGVFTLEQGIDAALDKDGKDEGAIHAVAYNRYGLPLATARMVMNYEPGVAKLGRMAVIAPMRYANVGAKVLQALMDAARAQGAKQMMLHAQSHVAAFYAKAGFVQVGEEFEEAGLAHVEMRRTLE
jgi:YbgC/YbaW family acyl-CoA thioester hydrolase